MEPPADTRPRPGEPFPDAPGIVGFDPREPSVRDRMTDPASVMSFPRKRISESVVENGGPKIEPTR